MKGKGNEPEGISVIVLITILGLLLSCIDAPQGNYAPHKVTYNQQHKGGIK